MEDQLISLETAKLAKEKGFDIHCDCSYNANENICFRNHDFLTSMNYQAPTQSLLQKWLREEHNLIVFVELGSTGYLEYYIPYCYVIVFKKKNYHNDDQSFDSVCSKRKDYDSYEEALEQGLIEALKMI